MLAKRQSRSWCDQFGVCHLYYLSQQELHAYFLGFSTIFPTSISREPINIQPLNLQDDCIVSLKTNTKRKKHVIAQVFFYWSSLLGTKLQNLESACRLLTSDSNVTVQLSKYEIPSHHTINKPNSEPFTFYLVKIFYINFLAGENYWQTSGTDTKKIRVVKQIKKN